MAELAVGFVGAGRLAAALSAAMVRAGYRVRVVASRERASAEALAAALDAGVEAAADARQVARASDLVFLAVPDGAIAAVAAEVAWASRHMVVHCSGAAGLDVLEPVVRAGGSAGCLHPLQSFPSRTPEPDRMHGISCGVEGAEPLGGLLEEIVPAMGARSFRLEGVDRALYHASAVFVSNHVVALASAATRTWTRAGLPAELAREALSPLLLAAAGNVSRSELVAALTGPIARGDAGTVEAHLRALADDPEMERLYRELSAELLRLPLGHAEPVRQRLHELLGGE